MAPANKQVFQDLIKSGCKILIMFDSTEEDNVNDYMILRNKKRIKKCFCKRDATEAKAIQVKGQIKLWKDKSLKQAHFNANDSQSGAFQPSEEKVNAVRRNLFNLT